jgi:hypothetical protein
VAPEDVQRKRHAVTHLPRLGDRREDIGGGDINRQGFVLPVLVEQRPRLIQRGRTGVDQRQHRCESRIAFAVAIRRSCQIEQPRIVAMDQTDLLPAAGSKCRKFHDRLLLCSDKIYDL